MRVLLDTHMLVWATSRSRRLPAFVLDTLNNRQAEVCFSVINIWEITIKNALGRESFQIDPEVVRDALLGSSYRELTVTGEHALAVRELPPIHRDPFDRMLIAQAKVEGLELYTSDGQLARYGHPVRYFS